MMAFYDFPLSNLIMFQKQVGWEIWLDALQITHCPSIHSPIYQVANRKGHIFGKSKFSKKIRISACTPHEARPLNIAKRVEMLIGCNTPKFQHEEHKQVL